MVASKEKTTIFDIVNLVFLIVVCITTIYPFIYLLFASVTPAKDMINTFILPIPSKISFESYAYIFADNSVVNAFGVTLYITIVGTVINLVMSMLAAYVLAQGVLPGKKLFSGLIVITMIFNGGIIPLFIVVKELGMYNTLWALMIPLSINTFWMMIMRNFFKGIPQSLAEAARIDGMQEFGILFKIIIPLSMPIIATLSLFYGVMHWNEYTNAIIYINSPKLSTLQVIIRGMYQSATSTMFIDTLPPPVESVRAATIMVATIPIIMIYPFLQKYFVSGIIVGAVKG